MKKYFIIAAWIAAAAGVAYTFYYLWQQSQPKEIVYEIEAPAIRDLRQSTVATGKVEPRDEVNIKPKIQGIITQLMVETGDVVREGDPIARVTVIPEIQSLSNAQSQLRSQELALQQTERDFARTKALFDKGVASAEDMEKAQTELEREREQVAAAKDNLEIITRGISSRSTSVNTTIVTSTVSGTILDIPVKVGSSVIQANTMNDGTTVATIANMADMIFRGNIDETEVGRLNTGTPITLTIGALQGVKIPATLEYVSPKGNESNGAVVFEIKAAAQIPDSITVRAGYSANAEIILAERLQALAIPEKCVEMNGDSSFVHILTSPEGKMPQTFERRAIRTGLSDGIYIEVLQGLKQEDRLRGNQQEDEE